MTTETRLLTDAEIERRLLDRRADAELDALFGALQHAELRDLARRGKDQRGGPRVLILPGSMGSTLGLRRPGRSTGFAEAFLRGGVANFIGTWWPVSDAAAALCASTLYERLMRGETIGASLQAARSKVLKLGSGDWANYLHYGGFEFVLKK